VGIDFSRGVLESIHKHQEAKTPLAISLMDIRYTRFSDNSFDGVNCAATLHCLPLVGPNLGADKAVEEAYRILRPGGIYSVRVKAETDVLRDFMFYRLILPCLFHRQAGYPKKGV